MARISCPRSRVETSDRGQGHCDGTWGCEIDFTRALRAFSVLMTLPSRPDQLFDALLKALTRS